jgi:ABC-type nitrate/sulfonate/bicarbonate transport system substrate-binding protein
MKRRNMSKSFVVCLVSIVVVALLSSTTVAGLTAVQTAQAQDDEELIPLTVTVATILTAPRAPIERIRADNQLLEKYGRELGYDLTVEHRDFPFGGPIIEGMIAGQIDFGTWDEVPMARIISTEQPLVPIGIEAGHQIFYINVRPGSDITSLEDLRGKSVGTITGTVFQGVPLMMFASELGTADVDELGISWINAPSPALLMTMPAGVDVVANNSNFSRRGYAEGLSVPLVSSDGYTGPAYDGPAGVGEGHPLPGFEESPFYPEAYYPNRGYTTVTRSLLQEHPLVVQAFIMATEEAARTLAEMPLSESATIGIQYWNVSLPIAESVVADELPYIRGWSWMTEAEALALLSLSDFLVTAGVIENPLDWEQIKEALGEANEVTLAAFEAMGEFPTEEEFLADDVPDLRGLPVWRMDEWEDR